MPTVPPAILSAANGSGQASGSPMATPPSQANMLMAAASLKQQQPVAPMPTGKALQTGHKPSHRQHLEVVK